MFPLPVTGPEPIVFNSGSFVSRSIAISSYFDRSGKDSGGIHSVCGLNIGFMNSPSLISFLNNVLPSLYLALSLSTDVDRYIL